MKPKLQKSVFMPPRKMGHVVLCNGVVARLPKVRGSELPSESSSSFEGRVEETPFLVWFLSSVSCVV